jgi:geranylgeranyl diphosphate synthase type I
MALIHDDLIDDAPLRRGLPSVHAAASSGSGGEARGRAIALVAGDLAAVWAEQMFMTSGFGPGALAAAAERSFAMRGEMAAGQYLGLAGAEVDPGLMAALKGGSYSVEGPLLIGAALAEAGPDVEASLRAFGRPLGMAFQAADDLLDGDADDRIDQGTVRGWLAQARAALDAAVLGDEVVAALEDLASVIG